MSTFLSTLDTLIPARDKFHARVLVRTVARDLRADAGAMSNIRQIARAREFADRVEAIGAAIANDRWDAAAQLWAAYKAAEKKYAAQMY